MTNWLERRQIRLHSGEETFFKIEEEGLTDEEIATFAVLIARRFDDFLFCDHIIGVPRGGLRIAEVLRQLCVIDNNKIPPRKVLIVDDVYTSGDTMGDARAKVRREHNISYEQIHGVVLFARRPPLSWIKAVFQLW